MQEVVLLEHALPCSCTLFVCFVRNIMFLLLQHMQLLSKTSGGVQPRWEVCWCHMPQPIIAESTVIDFSKQCAPPILLFQSVCWCEFDTLNSCSGSERCKYNRTREPSSGCMTERTLKQACASASKCEDR